MENFTANSTQVLSGKWLLACDPENKGKENKWFKADYVEGAKDTQVPGSIHEVYPNYHGVVWYWHKFTPDIMFSSDYKYFFKFGFVDYFAEFWLNGTYIGSHEGGEMSFELDVTDVLEQSGENLLSVRLINPTDQAIDGFILAETPHRNKVASGISPGCLFNYGGILYPVQLIAVPKIWISDVYVIPDVNTGVIQVNVSINNASGSNSDGRLSVSAGSKLNGNVLIQETDKLCAAAGENNYGMKVKMYQPHLWSIDDPYLYFINIRLEMEINGHVLCHDKTLQFGFREFKVERGYFRLNGKRIFIRSTHTGNHYPVNQNASTNMKYLYQDLIYAKAAGFNMVRFISGVAFPEQLDLCDEMGLLVYEECSASWLLKDSPKMKERFNKSTFDMIKRDRNHPSVVIWGLLNETKESAVTQHARSILQEIRIIDNTRLLIYSSGRWDCQMGVGTVCNPGSDEWQHEWGAEAPDKQPLPMEQKHINPWNKDIDYPAGLFEQMGDIHIYPLVPHSKENIKLIRTIGHDTKPVFLSEYGVGSLLDVIRHTRQFEEIGADPELPDAAIFKSMAEKFESDWYKYGMDGVYPFPVDFLRDSQRFHARLRAFTFDLVRSNPKYCGYSLTGMLDHAFTGEGLWTYFREWKHGIMDVLQDGWAPLRWCLFIDPMHVYSGHVFKAEVVLANEDVLKPGKYPVSLRISGPKGIVWEKRTEVSITEPEANGDRFLAVQVFNDDIRLDIESGVYEFTVYMEQNGAPAAGKLKFYVSDEKDFPEVTGDVVLWGVDKNTEAWLKSHTINCQDMDMVDDEACRLILVGDLSETELTVDKWRKLIKMIAKGSTVIFLSPASFKEGEDTTRWLPLEKKGRCYTFVDYMYHKECVAKSHPYFDGMQGKGILDMEYYDRVIANDLFEGQNLPDEVISAAFTTGYPVPGGYASGVLIGAYRLGAGRFVINSFHILENLGSNPAADRLILNMISYEQQFIRRNTVMLPADFDKHLQKLGY